MRFFPRFVFPFLKKALLFSSVAILFSSCFFGRKTSHHKLTENQKLDFAFNYFEGSRNKILGNNDKALNYFLQCLRIDGSNDAAMYEAAQIFEGNGKYDNALIFMRSAASSKPENIWYQLSLAELFQKNKKYNEAADVYAKLIKQYPERVDLYFELADSFLYGGKNADAIMVYDKISEMIGVTQEVAIQKQKLYLKMGKLDKAVAEIQKLIDTNPDEIRYYSLLVEMYQANNMNEKVLETLKKMESVDPNSPYLLLSKADYYRSIGEKEKSFSEIKNAFQSTKLDFDTKMGILSSYYIILQRYPELKEQALQLNQILVETHPEESRAFAVYGEFLYQDKKYEEAKVQYQKSLQLDKSSFMVWQQLLFCESDLQNYTEMEKVSEEALVLFPSQPLIYYFNGVAKIQNKKEKEAIDILNSGIKLVVENPPLKVQFYANLGDAHNRLKENAKSDSAFDKALNIDPKNSYVLNNFSYYLSLRADSLDKAAKMSLLSNQLEPNNASFQDTYGWILYVKGDYADAKQWLEKAIANGGENNAVILEHYGDVLWKLDMKDKAVEYWMKAEKAGKGSDFLEKKAAEKKMIE